MICGNNQSNEILASSKRYSRTFPDLQITQLTEYTDQSTAELDVPVLRALSTRGLQSTVPTLHADIDGTKYISHLTAHFV
jgi:hypothetical protein